MHGATDTRSQSHDVLVVACLMGAMCMLVVVCVACVGIECCRRRARATPPTPASRPDVVWRFVTHPAGDAGIACSILRDNALEITRS